MWSMNAMTCVSRYPLLHYDYFWSIGDHILHWIRWYLDVFSDATGFEHKASFRFVPGCACRAGPSPYNSSVATPDGWYYDVDTDADAECYTCFWPHGLWWAESCSRVPAALDASNAVADADRSVCRLRFLLLKTRLMLIDRFVGFDTATRPHQHHTRQDNV